MVTDLSKLPLQYESSSSCCTALLNVSVGHIWIL